MKRLYQLQHIFSENGMKDFLFLYFLACGWERVANMRPYAGDGNRSNSNRNEHMKITIKNWTHAVHSYVPNFLLVWSRISDKKSQLYISRNSFVVFAYLSQCWHFYFRFMWVYCILCTVHCVLYCAQGVLLYSYCSLQVMCQTFNGGPNFERKQTEGFV